MRCSSMLAPDTKFMDAIRAALDAIYPAQVVVFQQYLQELLDLLDAL